MDHSAYLYQAFFHGAGDAIFVFDATSKTVVEANAQALTDTNYGADEVKGLAMDRLFQPQNGSNPSALSINGDKASQLGHDELQLVKKNGETIAVTASVTTVKWDESSYLFMTARKTSVSLLAVGIPSESRAGWPEDEDFPSIIGQSEKIHDVCRLIGSVAKSEATVLIQGESGTGKEIVANVIHAHSHRCGRPFVKVNCAALTETLLESELFGHVKGAFTGAIRDHRGRFKQADGGTILLDEVGNMPLMGQAKLLRVLQEHEFEPVGSSVTTSVNVRVIAATNVDLEKAVSEGKFREDLYYRLKVFEIALPPLRERKEDIPLLSQHFLHQYTQSVRKEIRAIAPGTLALLMEHDWPGNVRELENAVEHAVIVQKGQIILPSSLPMNLTKSCESVTPEHSTRLGLRRQLNLLEKQILLDTLHRARGIKKHAAAMLGIDPRNMPYLLRKHRVIMASLAIDWVVGGLNQFMS
jgi:PAS domain S-box-containing protein